MKTIELLVNKPEFLKGSIITVDDVSAAVLIDKEEAKPYEPAADAADTDGAPKVKRGRRSRGTSQSVTVAEPDMPNTEADTGDGEVDGEGGGENV